MILTNDILKRIAGGKPVDSVVNPVVVSMNKYGKQKGLDRAHRLPHYTCQIAHESARFKHNREIWGPTAAQKRYEGRADLGNTQTGDGFRFRGRTTMQVTGRYNYRRFTQWVRKEIDSNAPDFEANPDAILTDPWEGLAPIWYWEAGNPDGRSLNRYADDNNIEAITRKINGGLNGYQDRITLYVRSALVIMGYPMTTGVVRRFQQDVGFTGKDVDDIAGIKTRNAMHSVLLNMAPLGEEVEEPEKPEKPDEVDMAPILEAIRESIEQSILLQQDAVKKIAGLTN